MRPGTDQRILGAKGHALESTAGIQPGPEGTVAASAGFFGSIRTRRRPTMILSMIAHTPVLPDRRVLERPEVGQALLASIQESIREGTRGILYELSLYMQDWDFRPEEIALGVDLWHGEADPIVPVAHARALMRQLPRVRPVILPGEGHFSLPINHMISILLALAG
jgi:pimeloyl-ACP methyl ester carboxylesterase